MKKNLKTLTALAMATAMTVSTGGLMVMADTASDTTAKQEQAKEVLEGNYGENIKWNINKKTSTLTLSGKGELSDASDDWKKEYGMEDVITDGVIESCEYSAPWEISGVKVKSVVVGGKIKAINLNLIRGVMKDGMFENIKLGDSVKKVINAKDVACESITVGKGFTDNIYTLQNKKLKTIKISSKNHNYKVVDGVVFSANGKNLALYPAGKGSKYTIPSKVKSIGAYAFANTSVKAIIIGKNIRTIGKGAFKGSKISNITFKEGVKNIYADAFKDCSKLKELKLPNSVVKMPSSAIGQCVKNIKLGSKFASSIDAKYWTHIEKITVAKNNKKYTVSNNSLYSKKKKVLYKYSPAATTFSISKYTTTIGDYAVYNNFNLKEVEIPSKVTKIGKAAFKGNKALTKLTLANNNLNVGKSAFLYTAIKEVDVPETVVLNNSFNIVTVLNYECDFDKVVPTLGYLYWNPIGTATEYEYELEIKDKEGNVVYTANNTVTDAHIEDEVRRELSEKYPYEGEGFIGKYRVRAVKKVDDNTYYSQWSTYYTIKTPLA